NAVNLPLARHRRRGTLLDPSGTPASVMQVTRSSGRKRNTAMTTWRVALAIVIAAGCGSFAAGEVPPPDPQAWVGSGTGQPSAVPARPPLYPQVTAVPLDEPVLLPYPVSPYPTVPPQWQGTAVVEPVTLPTAIPPGPPPLV